MKRNPGREFATKHGGTDGVLLAAYHPAPGSAGAAAMSRPAQTVTEAGIRAAVARRD